MSETGHLPTDVESSDRDPDAATLKPAPLSLFLSLLLSFSRSLALLTSPLFAAAAITSSSSSRRLVLPCPRSPPCSWRVGALPDSCARNLCPTRCLTRTTCLSAAGPPPDRRGLSSSTRSSARFEEREKCTGRGEGARKRMFRHGDAIKRYIRDI